MARERYVVHGMVQGVGFRWFVMREAHRLELRGWVKNLRDGSVEVVADGAANHLRELESVLQQGPSAAQVTGVDKSDVPHDMALPNFFDIK